MSETETEYEQSDDHETTSEVEVQRRPHRGGKSGHHKREEPTSLTDLQACPIAVTCFRYLSCYEFCERISQIQHHRELARLFVLHLHDGHVNQDKDLLKNIKNHYWARMHVCKAEMKVLQRKLAKAQKRRKRPDPLHILAEASLKEHGTK